GLDFCGQLLDKFPCLRVGRSCFQARYLLKKEPANFPSIAGRAQRASNQPIFKPAVGKYSVWILDVLNCVTQSFLDIEPTSDSAPRCLLQGRQVVEPPK